MAAPADTARPLRPERMISMKNWSAPGVYQPPAAPSQQPQGGAPVPSYPPAYQPYFYQPAPPPPPPYQPYPYRPVPPPPAYQPVQALPVPPPDPRKEYNRRRRKEYNSMGLALFTQLGLAFVITFLVVFGVVFISIFVEAGSGRFDIYAFSPEDVYAYLPLWLTPAASLAAYLAANVLPSVLFGNRQGLDVADMFRPKSTSLLVVLGGAAACLTINYAGGFLMQLINLILSGAGLELTTPELALEYDTAGNLLMFAYMVIVAPVTEELLFRGLLLRTFQRTGRTFAIIASSLLFAMVHGNFLQTVPAFLMGLVLGYTAMRCGSILPSILIHLINNGYVVLLQSLEEPLGGYLLWVEYAVLAVCLAGAVFALVRERRCFSALNERKAPKGSWGLFFTSWAVLLNLALYLGLCLTFVAPLAV